MCSGEDEEDATGDAEEAVVKAGSIRSTGKAVEDGEVGAGQGQVRGDQDGSDEEGSVGMEDKDEGEEDEEEHDEEEEGQDQSDGVEETTRKKRKIQP